MLIMKAFQVVIECGLVVALFFTLLWDLWRLYDYKKNRKAKARD